MSSVAEARYCANGEQCVRFDPAARKADKLSRYNRQSVCEACQRREAIRHDETPPEHAELFRVARLLFRAGVGDESDIIPTLVFAANVGEIPDLRDISNLAQKPLLRDISDGVAALDDPDRREAWTDFSVRVRESFDYLVAPEGTIEGAPILHQNPFRLILVEGDHEGLEEVNIDVFERSVQPDYVAKKYEEYLKKTNVAIDPSRGRISYKVYERFIRIVVQPETISMDRADGRILPLQPGPPGFPDPLVVAGVYSVLRGSRTKGKFVGLSSVLVGRERGPSSPADYLIPACVAWYVAGRGERIEQTEERHRAVRIVNQGLLGPCGKEPLPESSRTLWDTARNASGAIGRLEQALHPQKRTGDLGQVFGSFEKPI